MRYINALIVVFAVVAASLPAHAAVKTITLNVENMTCAGCPYQVKRSLTGIDGVESAQVSLETKQAVVTFDDAKTNTAALTAATANAGFPSKPVEAAGAAGQ